MKFNGPAKGHWALIIMGAIIGAILGFLEAIFKAR